DYAAAIPAFRAALKQGADSTQTRFYLGISLLLAGEGPAGIDELRAVADAHNSEFLERGRFYLAKALIAQHDIAGAQQQLDQIIAQHGDFEKRAKILRAQIAPAR